MEGQLLRLCRVEDNGENVADIVAAFSLAKQDWVANAIAMPTGDYKLLLYSPIVGEFQILDEDLALIGAGNVGPGWSSIMSFFSTGEGPRILFYNSSSGVARFAGLVNNAGFSIVFDAQNFFWGFGWTTFMPYTLFEVRYYFAYKKSTGEVAYCRLHEDGNGESTQHRANHTPGWSVFMPYTFSDEPHYLAYKIETGDVAFCRLTLGGNWHQTILRARHRPGWCTFMPFVHSNGTPGYIAHSMRSRQPNTAICRITHLGPTGEDTLCRASWCRNWTHFVCPNPTSRRYVALLGSSLMFDAHSPRQPTDQAIVEDNPWPEPLCFQLIPVLKDHTRFAAIQARLRESIPSAQLRALTRVCHPELYTRFRAEKESLRAVHGVVNSVTGWHSTGELLKVCGLQLIDDNLGTSVHPEHAQPAPAETAGFNLLFGSGGSYGRGAYFALHAKYSTFIWRRQWHTTGSYVLLLAEVALGRCLDLHGTVRPELRQAPSDFDSVQGTENGIALGWGDAAEMGAQWVVYQRYRAYPHYIVVFDADL